MTYAVGRAENFYLRVWDDHAQESGELMIYANVFTVSTEKG